MLKGKAGKNRILLLLLLLISVMFSLQGCKAVGQTTIALEQSVRCGMEEHIHGEDCYLGDVLLCGKKAHTHGENCYIVRLDDNDINHLLGRVDETEDHSLESLIGNVLRGALGLDPLSPTPTPTPLPEWEAIDDGNALTNDDIMMINRAITDGVVKADIVLNERLLTVHSSGSGMTEAEALAQLAQTGNSSEVNESDNGLSQFAFTPDTSTVASRNAYYYVYLDDQWQRIGYEPFDVVSIGWWFLAQNYRAETTSVITALVNNKLQLDNTLSDSDISNNIYYSESEAGSYSQATSQEKDGTAYTTYGTGSDTNKTFYVRIGGNNNSPSIKFYTVTFDYNYDSKGEYTYKIVRNGQTVTAPTAPTREGYTFTGWYTDAACTSEYDFSSAVNATTTLYAGWKINGYTVTWCNADGTVLETDTGLQAGDTPTYNGTTPTKAADAQYTYTFSGWDPAVTAVSGNATYMATYTKTVNKYTVTWLSHDGTVLETDENVEYGAMPSYDGASPTKTATAQYTYAFSGWSPDVTATTVVTSDTTYTAQFVGSTRQYEVTLKYIGADGNTTEITDTYYYGDIITLDEKYAWTYGEATVTEHTVTGKATLEGVIKTYTVTLTDEKGNTTTETVTHGNTVDLPSLPDGYIWVGSDGSNYASGDTTAPITQDVEFEAIFNYPVVYYDEDGTTVLYSDLVSPNSTITLRALGEGYRWVDQNGTVYEGETEGVQITGPTSFTKSPTITVSYDMNFPDLSALHIPNADNYWYNSYGEASASKPAIAVNGGESYTATYVSTDAVIAESLTSRIVYYECAELYSPQDLHYSVYFKGWQVTVNGTTYLVEPGAVIDWNTLLSYADGTNVSFAGLWETGNEHTVSFFLQLNGDSVDSGDSTNWGNGDYTVEIFATHLFMDGEGLNWDDANGALTTDQVQHWAIVDDSSDNSSDADKVIRSLYGSGVNMPITPDTNEEQTRFYTLSFPNDDEILAEIKQFVVNGTYTIMYDDGFGNVESFTAADADIIDTEHFTLRWYVFKPDGMSNWHVDGRLIKKLGQITVDKEFLGYEDAIIAAEPTFYAVAENGTVTNGVFTPYDSDNALRKQYVLTLTSDMQTSLEGEYPNATDIVLYDSGDTATHNYEWLIEGVNVDEYWQITEYTKGVSVDGSPYIYYAEYSVYDTDGVVTTLAEYGTTARALGKTFSLDEDPDQGLIVDFRNYYYPAGSLFFKKEDGKTGLPLGGAEFELRQGNNLLSFKYDADLGQYTYDSSNSADSITKITTGADGFTSIVITGFSYEYGDLVIEEVTAPAGYDKAPFIVLTEDTDGKVTISDVYYLDENGDRVEPAEPDAYHAKLEEGGEIIVVRDYSSIPVNVTVTKKWDNNISADNVTVVLQANDTTATNVFPGMENIQRVLSADNGWSYTWTDLPAYANGEPVVWSVKEIKVGDDSTTADGTFMSWVVTYSSTATDKNGDGVADDWQLTVNNTQKRPMLNVYKTDLTGNPLGGATFTLERVEWKDEQWQQVSGTSILTATTAADGYLRFDNLTSYTTANPVFYRLTETQPPGGYISLSEPTVLAIDVAGYVFGTTNGAKDTNTLSADYMTANGRYMVTVKNLSAEPLPETGGSGTTPYTLGGALLIAAALLMIYRKSRRKEDAPYV